MLDVRETSMEVPCTWTRVHLLYEGGGGTRVKPFGNFLRVVKQKLYRNVAQLVRATVL